MYLKVGQGNNTKALTAAYQIGRDGPAGVVCTDLSDFWTGYMVPSY